jgi:HAE1 family hydrophobic/amphiphilic exporter-1
MTEFALKRPVTTIIFFLIAIAFGVFAFSHLQIDLMPETELPFVNVSTYWYNSTPEVIQKEITTPIEEIAGKIISVKDIESESRYGQSNVKITFEKGANVKFATFLLKEELASLKKKLPRNITGPDVKAVLPKEAKREQKIFFQFEVSALSDIQKVREFVDKNVTPRFAAVNGVSGVNVNGGSRKIVKLTLNRKILKQLKIDSYLIGLALSEISIKYPVEPLDVNGKNIVLLVDNSPVEITDILKIPVVKKGERIITIGDIGQVSYGYKELYSLSRVNGKPTVTLDIVKARGANTVTTAKLCKNMVDFLAKRFPAYKFKILENGGEQIEKELAKVSKRGFYIFILIFVALSVFLLSLRTPLIIIFSIILSTVITLDLFYVFNIAINFVTISGLAMGFGMMVDNSIVVAESIIENIDLGLKRTDAVLKGTTEVTGSIFASTFTTVGGFFSFVFLSGRMAAYYMPLAFAITFSLIASMVVAFTIIPLTFMKWNLRSVSKSFINFNFLGKPVAFLSRYWIIPVLIVALTGYHSWYRFSNEVTRDEFFFGGDEKVIRISVRLPAESDIETVNNTLLPFEEKLLKQKSNGIENIVLNVYKTFGFITVTFKEDVKNTYFPLQVKSDMIGIASQLAGITIGVYGIDREGYWSSPGGGGGWMNSSITITGYSFDKVKSFAEKLKKQVLRKRRVSEAKIDFSKSWWSSKRQDEIVIHFKDKSLRNGNVSKGRLIAFIRKNLQTNYSNLIKIDGEELELEIRFNDFEGMEKEEFLGLKYKTRNGTYYRLGDLITFGKRKAGSTISKKNQKYLAVVKWDYKGSSKRARKFNKKVFEELQLPAGYTKEMESSYMTEAEEKMIYTSYFIALVVIYLILAAYFESLILPFAVLFSIPFALIGVFYIFYFGEYSFDSSAYMGLILLFGIVVNNAILYIDTYVANEKKDKVASSVRRARPVLLTTITTIVGMLPLILFQEEGANSQKIWVSLGIATTGGLLSSSIYIILFMPAFIFLFEKLQTFGSILTNGFLKGLIGDN